MEARLWADGEPLGAAPRGHYPFFFVSFSCFLLDFDALFRPLAADAVRSGFAELCPSAATARWWESPIPLILKVRDLPPSAVVALTVWGVPEVGDDVAMGGATLPLFSREGRLKGGRYRLRLHKGCVAEGGDPSATPGSLSHAPWRRSARDAAAGDADAMACDAQRAAAAAAAAAAQPAAAAARAAVAAADRQLRRYARGDVPRVPWLDALALPKVAAALASSLAAMRAAGDIWLSVSLPPSDYPVLWAEAPPPPVASGVAAPVVRQSADEPLAYGAKLVWFADAAAGRDNPAARRAAKLARAGAGLRSLASGGAEERDLKPDGAERKLLAAAIRAPPTRPLDAPARDALWKFRHSAVLRREPAALPKLLRCVDWTDAAEAAAAAELMRNWAPLAPAGALELLSPAFEGALPARAHAVACLAAASDDDIAAFLLQLVQALRFEAEDDSELASFLVARACQSAALACHLHWFLVVEWEDARFAPRATRVHAALFAACAARGAAGAALLDGLTAGSELVAQLALLTRELATVRGHARKRDRLRALLSDSGLCAELARFPEPLPLPLDPSVRVAGVLPASATVFKSALAPLRLTFRVAPPDTTASVAGGVTAAVRVPAAAAAQRAEGAPPCAPLPASVSPPPHGGGASSAGAALAAALDGAFSGRSSPGGSSAASAASSPPASATASAAAHAAAAAAALLPSSLPGGVVLPDFSPGIAAATAAMADLGANLADAAAAAAAATGLFPSADADATTPTAPGSPAGGGSVTLIYKKGDDLRQDQLCVQMISLMDRLLKRENLDLKLTPYRVLATGTDSGLVEYVPSSTVSAVLSEHRTILRYFTEVAPDGSQPHGVRADVFEAYIRSCAGSCVVTYLLGVGDRHLDNIMVAKDGRLFHIDFGYIMGRDPKMFPPPMKLCREMIEAMGGPGSAGYTRFKTLACEAYNILRKNAPLFLVLMQLMSAAGIPDVSTEPDKTLLRLEEKFALGLDDEAAVAHFAALINESASALFEALKENAHRIAQYWR